MLVGTLLARGEGHEREPEEGEEEEYRRTTEEKERDDDSYVSANTNRGNEGKQKGGRRRREEKKKSEGESFTPRVTRRKFARERSALATRLIMRSRERVHVCVRMYTVHDFVNPALDRSYYAINFNSHP